MHILAPGIVGGPEQGMAHFPFYLPEPGWKGLFGPLTAPLEASDKARVV